MFYRVRARLKPATAAEFHTRLSDGTIARQRPDGPEMVAAMRRAVVIGDGSVQWSEQCFCGTPLAHERQTVFDRYFEDLSTEPIDGFEAYDGTPFMTVLERAATTD